MNTDRSFRKIMFLILTVALFSLMLTGVCMAKEEKPPVYPWLNQIRNDCFVQDTGAGAESLEPADTVTFKLPASLQVIEDEAFEGTAIVSIDLPETVESIGERAFADIPTLLSVKIPEKTKEIARTAFSGSNNVTITAAPNSYARTWAKDNGIPFSPIVVMHAGTGNPQVSTGLAAGQTRIDIEISGAAVDREKMPHWRPIDEIKAEQYDQYIANCILGRAPPACA